MHIQNFSCEISSEFKKKTEITYLTHSTENRLQLNLFQQISLLNVANHQANKNISEMQASEHKNSHHLLLRF